MLGGLGPDSLTATASDFFDGSDAAISEAEVVVRARVREHPQETVAWMPDHASPAVEAAEMDKLIESVPTEVTAKVRRYRRGGGRQ